MGIVALVLLIVWLLGIVVMTASVIMALKDEKSQTPEVLAMRMAAEINPVAVTLVLSLVIFVWPASLLYGALKKGSN